MVRDLYTKAMLAIITAALLSLFAVYRVEIVQNGFHDHAGPPELNWSRDCACLEKIRLGLP
jgi:hypothetical protein